MRFCYNYSIVVLICTFLSKEYRLGTKHPTPLGTERKPINILHEMEINSEELVVIKSFDSNENGNVKLKVAAVFPAGNTDIPRMET